MKLYGYIKNSDISNQKELIRNMNINAKRLNPQSEIDSVFIIHENDISSKINNRIDYIIDTVGYGNTLIIVDLTYLGNSLSHILQSIEQMMNKHISIYFMNLNINITPYDSILNNIITTLCNVDTYFKNERLASSAQTRKKNGTTLGRKSGKKTKSMFDKHKKKILKLNNLGVPKVKILNEIKKNDIKLKDTSTQALGQYIKKVKLKENTSLSYEFKRNYHPVISISK